MRNDSCLSRAKPDEFIFVLRANDETAPHTVREWAYRYLESKGGLINATDAQIRKYNEALGLAGQMELWRKNEEREQFIADINAS